MKSIVITGASTGIGKACALHFDKLGYQVFAGVRKEADAKTLSRAATGALQPIILDVTKKEQIKASMQIVKEKTGGEGLDALINNAGIGYGGALEGIDVDDLRQQFEVNVFGLIAVTQSFLPLLRKKQGRLVNMSSVSGKIASAFLGPYCASKYAVEALSDSLRQELHPLGVQVSLIEPGAVQTEIWNKAEENREKIHSKMADEIKEIYREGAEKFFALVEESKNRAIPVEHVVKAVDRAIHSQNPKTRYVVGKDARMGIFFKNLLPDRWMDGLMRGR